MPNSRFKIVGNEFLTSIDYDDEFHVNLLFDRSIYNLSTDVRRREVGGGGGGFTYGFNGEVLRGRCSFHGT